MLLLKAASGLAAEDPVPRTMLAAGAPAARELDAAEAQTVDAGGQAQVSTQTLKAAAGSAQAAGDPPATEAVKPAMQGAAEPPAEDEGLPAASDHAAPASVLGYLRGWQASLCSLFGSAVFVCRMSLPLEPLRRPVGLLEHDVIPSFLPGAAGCRAGRGAQPAAGNARAAALRALWQPPQPGAADRAGAADGID